MTVSFSIDDTALLQVTTDPRTDRDPMWIGDANLFQFRPHRRVQSSLRYDVATPAKPADHPLPGVGCTLAQRDADGQIAVRVDGELHIYDTRDGNDRPLVDCGCRRAVTLRLGPQPSMPAGQHREPRFEPAANGWASWRAATCSPFPWNMACRAISLCHRPRTTGTRLVERRQAPGFRVGSQREEEIYVQAQDGNSPAVK